MRRRIRSELGNEMAYEFDWFGNNRHICDVLDDMRKLDKAKNYSGMKGLIEEAQSMANRMEAALRDQKDLIKLQKETSKARKAYKALQNEYEELQSKIKEIKPKPPEELKKSES